MASETTKKVSAVGASVADRTKDASQNASSSAADTGAYVRDQAAKVVDAAGDLYSRAADRAQDALSDMPSATEARAKAEKFALRGRQQIDKRVAKQPIEALLLAGAIGYLVGWATTRG